MAVSLASQGRMTDRGEVITVLRQGTERAREKASTTLTAVKRALGLAYFA